MFGPCFNMQYLVSVQGLKFVSLRMRALAALLKLSS